MRAGVTEKHGTPLVTTAACKPEYCSGARQEDKGNLTNALPNALGNDPPARPDPTRPKGEGKGKATPARPKGRSAPPREKPASTKPKTLATMVTERDARDEREDLAFVTWKRSSKKWADADENETAIGSPIDLAFCEWQKAPDGQNAFNAKDPTLPEWETDEFQEYDEMRGN